MSELINIKTGEVLDIDCNDWQLSDALKLVRQEKNRLEKIESALSNAIKDRIPEGETKFADYWEVQYRKPSISESEDYKLLSPENKKQFRHAKKMFDTFKKVIFQDILEKKKPTIILKFPKY